MMLSVVIPCYNEEKTIISVLDAVNRSGFDTDIIVVDDGSTDSTVKLLQNYKGPSVRIVAQPKNRGKGAALRVGFDMAVGDIVLVQDADLEYSPEDYPILLKPILSGRADAVYGSRFQGGPGRVLYYFHMLGNKCLTTLSNIFTGLNLTDMETCYKVFRREIIQSLNLRSNRFGIEPEITAKIARIPKIRIYEVPIQYHGRTYLEGKKVTWKDGIAAVAFILIYSWEARFGRAYRQDTQSIIEVRDVNYNWTQRQL